MQHIFQSYYLDSPLVAGRVFDVFEPETITKDVALFFVHGGGWRAGSRTLYHGIMEEFNKRGYIVASTDYRLYAKDAFEQIQDVREAYDRFVSLLKEKNRPLKIAVFGESAGAHLAAMLTLALPNECGEKCTLQNEWVQPSFAMLQSTPTSLESWEAMMPSIKSMFQSIVNASYEDDPERYARLAPKNYVRESNPPIFFMEAELEHLFLSEYTLEIAKKHRAWGIESHWKVYEKMEHGFFFALNRKKQREALEDVCLFLEGNLKTI